MRKLGFVVAGLLCAVGLLSMQASVAAKAKTVKDEITISSDLKVGTAVLKAGSYRVESDGSKITFQHLLRSVDGDAQADPAGSATVLKGVQIRGSEVAFTVSN